MVCNARLPVGTRIDWIPETPAAREVKRLEPLRRALCTARALLMTGQRRPRTCRLDIVPPPGLVLGRVAVERVRRVVGDVRLRKGHIVRDCCKRASMVDLSQRYEKKNRNQRQKSPSIQEIVQVNISKTGGTRGKIDWGLLTDLKGLTYNKL